MPDARLVATVTAPLGAAGAPEIIHRTLLVQRGDAELVVRDLDGIRPERRFPAPWPRDYGSVTVSPGGDLAVFGGVHAIRAVDVTGAVRWELRHGCWSAAVCEVAHEAFDEYAGEHYHATADSGSAAFSADGRVVWAHVRANQGDGEEWLVLDAGDGTVLARADTMTVGSMSWHVAHPDPAFMGLSIGTGDEDAPTLWGRWAGGTLTVTRLPGEVLLDVSPSGEHFLTVDVEQSSLGLYRAVDGAELRRADAEDDDEEIWEYAGAVPWDTVALAGVEVEVDEPEHWLIDLGTMTARGPVAYPFPVWGPPRPVGPGTWCTVARDDTAVHLWALAGLPEDV
ncbi:hypothetical protein [Actinoplanes sp. L3-i22]|uniref:hypothetical protein n=1 Tax=Actinoplanes sp. L3-i22 TaxID=2836373 RepID=UPI001C74D028|nr:hypothetical protein [Actinoplanes sp. L3-i22]BCY12921.1 hypothetical protein L3i22_080090 [Actinoplanes sp. L3-i22]